MIHIRLGQPTHRPLPMAQAWAEPTTNHPPPPAAGQEGLSTAVPRVAAAAQGKAPGIWAGVSSPHRNPETVRGRGRSEPLPAHLPPASTDSASVSPPPPVAPRSSGKDTHPEKFPLPLCYDTGSQVTSQQELPGSATARAPDTGSRCPAPPPDCPVPCLWAADGKVEGI